MKVEELVPLSRSTRSSAAEAKDTPSVTVQTGQH